MSEYYKANRTRNIYDPESPEPFKVSRSKIENFMNCPKCFYLDRRLGIGQPPGYPFALNSAVDHLLKQEFDIHRVNKEQHPIQKEYGIDAIPVAHEDLNIWRANFKGLQFHHKKTNLIITGAIDDLWINSKKEYIIVDYKATAKEEAVTELDKKWQDGYKHQMEIYQWILRQMGYKVSDIGYFVYCTGKLDRKAFDKKLEFDVNLIKYKGSDKWVEDTILKMKKCLDGKIPESDPDCDYCNYREAVRKIE